MRRSPFFLARVGIGSGSGRLGGVTGDYSMRCFDCSVDEVDEP